MLRDAAGILDEEGATKSIGSNFYLAYHDEDNRFLLEARASLYRSKFSALNYTSSALTEWRVSRHQARRIRIGFISEYLCDHTIGRLFRGILRTLDRTRFEVWLMHSANAGNAPFRALLDSEVDHAVTLPRGLRSQQEAIATSKLDVLFYPDIGMSPETQLLAFARLAPVQVVSWGHPDTTGIDTLDYYLSTTCIEPQGAEDLYSEQLVRLSRLPSYYEATAIDVLTTSRADHGLPETGTLYGCPQSLFKLHPDFDAHLNAIAEGDPEGHIVFLQQGGKSQWVDQLKARWAKNISQY